MLIGVVIDQAVATGATRRAARLARRACRWSSSSCRSASGSAPGPANAPPSGRARLRLELTTGCCDPRGGAEAGRLPGALVNVATGDAQRVGVVNMALPLGFAALAGVVVGAVALLRMSVPLGLLVLLGAPLLLLCAHLLSRPLQRRSEVEQDRAAHAAGVAADLVAGLRVLKGIGAERAAAERYRRTSRDSLARHDAGREAKSWHDGTLLGLTGLFLAVVALVGGRLAARGEISVGELVAAVGLAQFLLGPLSMFAWVNGELAQGRASADRIAAVLASPPAGAGGDRPLAGRCADGSGSRRHRRRPARRGPGRRRRRAARGRRRGPGRRERR